MDNSLENRKTIIRTKDKSHFPKIIEIHLLAQTFLETLPVNAKLVPNTEIVALAKGKDLVLTTEQVTTMVLKK